MSNQEIIDKYLQEFHEVHGIKVPIELNPYIHRMIEEVIAESKGYKNYSYFHTQDNCDKFRNINTIPCPHNFVQKDEYWSSCTHCGCLRPLYATIKE